MEEQTEEKTAEDAPTCTSCESCTKGAEDVIRDLINDIAVMKAEELEGVTTKISPDAAEILTAKLEQLAKKVGEIC